jgi:hypothetical protein
MWKCQNCGGLQRINAFCKYCGFKFPTITAKQLREIRKRKDLVIVKNKTGETIYKFKKPHGRFD